MKKLVRAVMTALSIRSKDKTYEWLDYRSI
jgi:hypothetical protein